MSTTNRTVEALENAQPHELLSAFVVRFNDLSGQLDEVSQERDELDIQVAAAATTQAALLARIADLEQENERCCEAARKAEKIGTEK